MMCNQPEVFCGNVGVECNEINPFTDAATVDSSVSSKEPENELSSSSLSFNPTQIIIDRVPYTSVTEGTAEVLFRSTLDVFYNPVQEFNRDISIAVMKQYVNNLIEDSKKEKNESMLVHDNHSIDDTAIKKEATQPEITVLEALSASGLRAIRYAKEIPGLTKIVANDVSSQAFECIEQNILHNKVEHLVTPNKDDAVMLMYQNRSYKSQFSIIDIDPYGSPSPFLDSGVQSVKDGGLLMVTCTDLAILCGNNSSTCRAKYGAVSLKGKNCHEMALRIVLQSIESHANRYGRYIVPLLSLSADFYVRVFVKIYTSPSQVKRSASKMAMVYQCVGCETFHLQPLAQVHTGKQGNTIFSPGVGPPVNSLCSECEHKHHVGGPIWISHLHNQEFLKSLIQSVQAEEALYKTARRMLGILNLALEELPDCPLYYSIDRLCAIVHSTMPSFLQLRSAFLNSGYQVSLSHACPTSLKTNAPPEFIWDVMRTWVTLNPIKRTLENGSAAQVILSKELRFQVSFEIHPESNPTSREKSLLRYQINPEPFWGPKTKAKTSLWSSKQLDKQKRMQGKRKKREPADLKIFTCKKFKEGTCEYGEECRYSHILESSTDEISQEGPMEN